PLDALQWAGQLPAETGLKAGGTAFAEWRSAQPDAAMKWLDDLPQDDARRATYFRRAIESIAYQPQAAEQLAGLAGEQQTTARAVVESMTLPSDRRAKLLEALAPR